jgi:hypothetical protein
MSAPRPSRVLLVAACGAVAGSAALLSAGEASAAGPGGPSSPIARWYVETSGPECAAQRDAFEREIRLTCEAVGGSCAVVASPSDAGLRAVLDCSAGDEAWSVVTRTSNGTVLATVGLSGAKGDRLREAAVEVARDATPERSLAIETLRFSLAGEAPVHEQRSTDRLALALGGTVSASSDRTVPTMFGAHVMAGLELARSVRATLGGVAEAGGGGTEAARGLRGGVGLALGAPFDATAPIGFAFEGGASAVSTYVVSATNEGVSYSAHTRAAAYAQGTLTVQWPRDGLRPFAALTGGTFSEPVQVAANFEIGVALALF